jgi:hypothetical protein
MARRNRQLTNKRVQISPRGMVTLRSLSYVGVLTLSHRIICSLTVNGGVNTEAFENFRAISYSAGSCTVHYPMTNLNC